MPVGPGHPQAPSVYQPPPWPPVHCPTPGGARGKWGRLVVSPPALPRPPLGCSATRRGPGQTDELG